MSFSPQRLSVLAESRTVVVTRCRLEDGTEVVQKTYSFPTWKDRLRGAFRGTWLGRNKAYREYRNLEYLRQHGIGAVEPLAWNVHRGALGFVATCTLTTRAHPGADLAQLLLQGRMPSLEIWAAIGDSVRCMHALGYWHRGLSARNLVLGTEVEDVCWLDPSKSLTYPQGGLPAGARAQDLLRFWSPLLVQVPAAEQQAFAEAYGQGDCLDIAGLWQRIPSFRKKSTRFEIAREMQRAGLRD